MRLLRFTKFGRLLRIMVLLRVVRVMAIIESFAERIFVERVRKMLTLSSIALVLLWLILGVCAKGDLRGSLQDADSGGRPEVRLAADSPEPKARGASLGSDP